MAAFIVGVEAVKEAADILDREEAKAASQKEGEAQAAAPAAASEQKTEQAADAASEGAAEKKEEGYPAGGTEPFAEFDTQNDENQKED